MKTLADALPLQIQAIVGYQQANIISSQFDDHRSENRF